MSVCMLDSGNEVQGPEKGGSVFFRNTGQSAVQHRHVS
jgi:hypothetical protein